MGAAVPRSMIGQTNMIDINIERVRPNVWQATALVCSELLVWQYYFMPKREALRLFREFAEAVQHIMLDMA